MKRKIITTLEFNDEEKNTIQKMNELLCFIWNLVNDSSIFLANGKDTKYDCVSLLRALSFVDYLNTHKDNLEIKR